MIITKSKSFKIAIALEGQTLRQLVDILTREISGDIRLRVQCLDRTSFETSQIEDVLDYPNLKGRELIRLYITAEDRRASKYVDLRFASGSYLNSVDYTIREEDRDVLFLSDKIEQVIEGISQ